MMWVWQTYAYLSASRQSTQSGLPARITMQEIQAICYLLDIKNQDNIDLLLNVIIDLDDVFMKDAIEKKKKRDENRERQNVNAGKR